MQLIRNILALYVTIVFRWFYEIVIGYCICIILSHNENRTD